MIRAGSFFVLFLFGLFQAFPLLAAQDAAKCSAILTDPRPGEDVGGHIIARGTAILPARHHLWVFARRVSYRSLKFWFQQGEGEVQPNGEWKVSVAIGNKDDIGWDFDVTAAVFDEQQHLNLLQSLRDSILAKDFQPIEMPAAVCVAETVTVHKTKQ